MPTGDIINGNIPVWNPGSIQWTGRDQGARSNPGQIQPVGPDVENTPSVTVPRKATVPNYNQMQSIESLT